MAKISSYSNNTQVVFHTQLWNASISTILRTFHLIYFLGVSPFTSWEQLFKFIIRISTGIPVIASDCNWCKMQVLSWHHCSDIDPSSFHPADSTAVVHHPVPSCQVTEELGGLNPIKDAFFFFFSSPLCFNFSTIVAHQCFLVISSLAPTASCQQECYRAWKHWRISIKAAEEGNRACRQTNERNQIFK